MASKGKKQGKKKGQTLNLTEFLSGEGGGAYKAPGSGATTTVAIASTWADEMDDDYEVYPSDRVNQQVVLPTAPRAALGPDIDDSRIPRSPPYTAYVANLPYDVDEEQVRDVFVRCKLRILSVRLMKDEGGRLKGFGYADFEDRDSLIDALSLTDACVNNRKMRIDLASGAGKDGERRAGGGFGDRFGDRNDRGPREEDPDAGRSDQSDDWRRGPPPPPRESDRDRGRDNDGGGRGFDRYEPARERGGFGGFSRDRNDRDDRGGGRSYGFGSRDGGREGGRDGGRDDRYGDRRRSPEQPKERPRLNLAPRTKPKEEEEAAPRSEVKERPAPEPRKAANIFGSAKPVDTAQREKEIEEKIGQLDVKEDSDRPAAYRPPGARDRGEDRRDDRRDDRGGSRSGYDRKDDRDRGYSSRDDRGYGSRDDRGYGSRDDRDRGYGNRDDRGYGSRDDRGYGSRDDRGSDRRDDRGSDRRDDRGYDRRDDRGYDRKDDRKDYGYDRRDDRGYDRREDRRGNSGYNRHDDRRDDRGYSYNSRDRDERGGSAGKDDRRENGRDEKDVIPPMKKFEEPKAPDLIAPNKFAFLKDEAESASETED